MATYLSQCLAGEGGRTTIAGEGGEGSQAVLAARGRGGKGDEGRWPAVLAARGR